MKSGQSLFEVVMALSVISLIIFAVVILATNSIRNSSFSRDKTLAANYSQEGIEWLRGQRDSNWSTFVANINTCPAKIDSTGKSYINHCFPAGGLSWNRCDCGSTDVIGNIFKRETDFYCRIVTQSNPTPDPSLCSTVGINDVQTNVKVSWSDSQGLHEVFSSTNFSNWLAK